VEEAVILAEEGRVAIGNAGRLNEQDRDRISQAVQAAERQTAAEIVPMIVSRSGVYRDARHRAGVSLALLVLACGLMFEATWLPWGWHAANAAWLLLATVSAYAFGTWLGMSAPIIRVMTSTERMQQKVKLRAERAFAQHAISQTRERTGVLLMLSMLERQIYVLPDKDIARRVSSEEWVTVVCDAVERLKAGDLVGGLCAGIDRCGALMARVCPVNPNANPNEIPDRVIEEP
jgi:putative membrane protein